MKINHLGIATKSIEESLKFWQDSLGLENVHTEVVEEQKWIEFVAHARRNRAA